MLKAGLLCALVLCFQAALAQTTDSNLPPEDLDSSGDDDDSFSGSGAGSPLLEHPVIALGISPEESTNSSLTTPVPTDLGGHEPELWGMGHPSEDAEQVHLVSTRVPEYSAASVGTDEPTVMVEDEIKSLAEKTATELVVITTSIPVTHSASTLRVTTSQAPSTSPSIVKAVEPIVHYDVSSVDEGAPVSDVVATTERHLDATNPTATSSVPHKDIVPLPEEGFLPPEESSGIEEDFTFTLHDEKPVIAEDSVPENTAIDAGVKDSKSAEAAQGIMDRKEVLAGVVTGGLVGLLFAAFLVGFMLYRMKKKDEGSYSLDEPKQSNGGYQKPHKQEEFYA